MYFVYKNWCLLIEVKDKEIRIVINFIELIPYFEDC